MKIFLPGLLLTTLSGTQDTVPPQVELLAEGVHRIVLDGGFPANVTALVSEEGVLLVDSGFDRTQDALGAALRSLGTETVKAIVNTHPHGDHFGGNGILAADGTVYCRGPVPGQVTTTLVDGTTRVEFGGETVHLVPLAGGHSGTDLAIHFERAKVLCLGDLYLSESFPTVDVNGGGGAASLLAGLERALELFPADVKVVPGHGRVTTMAELRRYVERMGETVAIVRTEMAAGLSREQIQRKRPLRDYVVWGKFFPFINEQTWVNEVFASFEGWPSLAEEELFTGRDSSADDGLSRPRLSVLFNHEAVDEDFETAWGFACLIEGCGQPILFDTGLDGEKLLANMERLELDPTEVEAVVLSHAHGDHTQGLPAMARKQPRLSVYSLDSFPSKLNGDLERVSGTLTLIGGPREIAPGVHTTGDVGGEIPEQALFLETPEGLVIITGCAHPGICQIVRRAKQVLHRPILLVVGGFHLGRHSDEAVEQIIVELKDIGVQKIAATHCTGERAVELFREAWGDDFVDALCGTVWECPGR